MAPPAHRALKVIAAYKLFKACALLLVAATAFHLTGANRIDVLSDRLMQLPIHHGHRYLVGLIDEMFELGPRRFLAIGMALCIYASVFFVEGWGLWREKRWAEYLTVIVTASLVPLEVWEMARQFSGLKLLALLANLAIVAYLIHLLRQSRADPRRV